MKDAMLFTRIFAKHILVDGVMSFSSIIYSVIVLPIESLIEFVFCFTLSKFDEFGVAPAIFAVSLAVNFLALPIYNVADKIQLNERNLQQKMSRYVNRIKSVFKGDEQFMILSTYYRQNNYRPIYAFRQSLSVLIQIPFFIAAYHFLSRTSLLDGKGVFFLKDLAQPDALLTIPMARDVVGGGYGVCDKRPSDSHDGDKRRFVDDLYKGRAVS